MTLKNTLARLLDRHLTRRYRLGETAVEKVAVMVPLPKPELSEDERISLAHLHEHLGHHDRHLLVPAGSGISLPGFHRKEVARRFFGSVEAHNRMLYSLEFWSEFRAYEYILMYHLDALVFRDELREWCERDIDYIGAPWILSPDTPWVEEEGIGNGGFALYRVPSVIRVLRNRYLGDPKLWFIDRHAKELEITRRFLERRRRGMTPRLAKPVGGVLNRWIHKLAHIEVNRWNNDIFWSSRAIRHDPEFRVGSFREGLQFAFEVEPAACFERNGRRLPFGAHAWARYDRGFWEPHLVRPGQSETASGCGSAGVPAAPPPEAATLPAR